MRYDRDSSPLNQHQILLATQLARSATYPDFPPSTCTHLTLIDRIRIFQFDLLIIDIRCGKGRFACGGRKQDYTFDVSTLDQINRPSFSSKYIDTNASGCSLRTSLTAGIMVQ